MNSSLRRTREQPFYERITLVGAKVLIRVGLLVGAWQFRRGGELKSRKLIGLLLNAIYVVAYALGAVGRGINVLLTALRHDEGTMGQSYAVVGELKAATREVEA